MVNYRCKNCLNFWKDEQSSFILGSIKCPECGKPNFDKPKIGKTYFVLYNDRFDFENFIRETIREYDEFGWNEGNEYIGIREEWQIRGLRADGFLILPSYKNNPENIKYLRW